jgi:hypothetical protein
LRLPLAILAILLFGIAGVVLFRAGADEKPHSVLLKWNPPAVPAGSNVAGYNVYRSQSNGPYQQIATGVSAPTYVDHDVKAKTAYEYYVKTVDSAGKESQPSNHASAAIP